MEVGGVEPPSLAKARSRPLHPLLVVVLRGIAWRHRLAVSFRRYRKNAALSTKKSPHLSGCELSDLVASDIFNGIRDGIPSDPVFGIVFVTDSSQDISSLLN